MDDIQFKRMQRRKRQRRRRMIFRLILILLLISISSLIYFKFIKSDDIEKEILEDKNSKISWNIMVVNYDNKIPESYRSFLVDFVYEDIRADEQYPKIDYRIYSSLKEMFEDAQKDGINLRISSAYRSRFEQNKILMQKIADFQKDGYSPKKAKKEALKWVAMPGHSEHETGLAVDINRKGATSSKAAYKWLEDNSYRYGFIKRYPRNKRDITKISNEPWHYRYVGGLISRIIEQNDICLEELEDLLN